VDYRTDAIAAALHAMLAAEPGITGILATSDFMSTVTVEWLHAHGIAVPQEMSVVGIRGTDTAPAGRRLTSVDVQIATCSRAALDYIAARSAGQAAHPPALFAPALRAGETLALR
jgi:DNA-binding LacI/PurR family transcriptional regulator